MSARPAGAALPGTLARVTVTWTRWDQAKRRSVTSHPMVWLWTDIDGVERIYDTKAEALTMIAALGGES